MAQAPPTLGRKSSAPWDRLRPVKQDPLEAMGFVSKGDNRLLEVKTQQSFYNKIVARYMQFCAQHSKDLDSAFASLTLDEGQSPALDPLKKSTGKPTNPQPAQAQGSSQPDYIVPTNTRSPNVASPLPASELSIILLALRKLREGLLASSASAPNPVFSQRVHVFNIRVAILALHPEGYHPSLMHLLSVLHTSEHPLPRSELVEMTTYLILDMAIRQHDLYQAYALRYNSRVRFGYKSRVVDSILKSIVIGDWVTFWRVRQKVDGYVRAILYWHLETQRKMVLKTIGRAYYACDVDWILQSATGGQQSWDELVKEEDVGWMREGDKVVIRKPKAKTS
ncbi:uncharacterized protein Z520_04870 [Fonsecaea multimorphosa CBS 102226]|uniref:CSN8/PSMD8/EIF3K domain-containing protein n=1 Tax=Fonsecaea multimorphosa CBS 102226 TaxID=1442371 RepID=A0A0D2K817_9EURO|nr:uncharacterized protein Z520_04870 [Fonsecaea multimorphosa CBS 102226]KIX99294.1 hypothetical protein Z520_04870 [Fonsecaea multimorphosa CBS 102226]OAL25986.1 hypothetical protein AYO22_04613 [Fonsecaea multimorphosa]